MIDFFERYEHLLSPSRTRGVTSGWVRRPRLVMGMVTVTTSTSTRTVLRLRLCMVLALLMGWSAAIAAISRHAAIQIIFWMVRMLTTMRICDVAVGEIQQKG